jgi:hypothetical protein
MNPSDPSPPDDVWLNHALRDLRDTPVSDDGFSRRVLAAVDSSPAGSSSRRTTLVIVSSLAGTALCLASGYEDLRRAAATFGNASAEWLGKAAVLLETPSAGLAFGAVCLLFAAAWWLREETS